MNTRIHQDIYDTLTRQLDAFRLAGKQFLTTSEVMTMFGRKDPASTRSFMREKIGVVIVGNRLTCPLELVAQFIRDHYCPSINDQVTAILHTPVKRSSRRVHRHGVSS